MQQTPFQQNLDADTALVTAAAYGPAEPVTLVDVDGNAFALRGLFEIVGLDVAPGAAQAPALSGGPVLHLRVSDVQAALGRPISRRDSFFVRGKVYRAERPAEDGFGLVAVKLLEKEGV